MDLFTVQTRPLPLWTEKKKLIFSKLSCKTVSFVEILEIKRERSPSFAKHVKTNYDYTD